MEPNERGGLQGAILRGIREQNDKRHDAMVRCRAAMKTAKGEELAFLKNELKLIAAGARG